MDRDTGAIVLALVVAPAAIILLVALLRGYTIDIHFKPGEGGIFRRRSKPKDTDEGDT
jgi:hypothetical protein